MSDAIHAQGIVVSPSMSTRKQNAMIEYLRGIGAVAIIYFHIGLPFGDVAVSALSMFVLLSAYFGFGADIGKRARRLLVPWLVWSLVYLVLKLINVALSADTFAGTFHPYMLLTGPSIHLWFLPFIFLFSAWVSTLPRRFLPPALIGSGILAYLVFNATDLPWPFTQWLSVWPAACAGALMAATGRAGTVCLGFAAIMGVLAFSPIDQYALQLCLAGVASWIGMVVFLPMTGLAAQLGRYSLGIYLAHPMVIAGLVRFDLPVDFWFFALAVILSAIMSIVIEVTAARLTPLLRARGGRQAG